MADWMSRTASLLRLIIARETLSPAPPAPPPAQRPGLLALLFAPEPLPDDPPLAARPRGRWLAWLFAPERLDE
jgi:hypothetical protein